MKAETKTKTWHKKKVRVWFSHLEDAAAFFFFSFFLYFGQPAYYFLWLVCTLCSGLWLKDTIIGWKCFLCISEQRTTQQGQIYFLHTRTGVSTWHDPRVPRSVFLLLLCEHVTLTMHVPSACFQCINGSWRDNCCPFFFSELLTLLQFKYRCCYVCACLDTAVIKTH